MKELCLSWFLLFLVGCSAPSPWHTDSISAGDPLFNSNRLTYIPLDGDPPWKIEFLQMGEEFEVFISLLQHRFQSSQVKVTLFVEEKFEGIVPVFEGNMKLRLVDSLASFLIHSLQEGKEVSIIADGFKGTIDPDLFNKNFASLKKKKFDWLLIRNPLQ